MKTPITCATTLLSLGLMLTIAEPVRAQIVFSDGTFNDGDWTAFKINFVSIATISAAQQTSGGNPGAYRRVDHMNFNDLLHVLHLRSGAVVNPNLTPITGMSFSIDEIAIQNLFGVGVGVYPAFQQNGKNYLALSNILVNSDFSWQTLNASGLTAASFTTISDANDHPDFSTTGSLIQFGFVTANNNGSPPIMASRAAGFDNWSYAVTTVPEPGSLLLCGVMALGWAVRRYRRTSTIPNERVTQ